MKARKYINELIGIPISILIFWISPYLIRLVDPTAGAYDAGVLQKLSVAAVYVLCINTAVWIGVYVVFPYVFRYFNDNENGFRWEYNNLNRWQRVKLSLFVYCFFMAVYVAALQAV